MSCPCTTDQNPAHILGTYLCKNTQRNKSVKATNCLIDGISLYSLFVKLHLQDIWARNRTPRRPVCLCRCNTKEWCHRQGSWGRKIKEKIKIFMGDINGEKHVLKPNKFLNASSFVQPPLASTFRSIGHPPCFNCNNTMNICSLFLQMFLHCGRLHWSHTCRSCDCPVQGCWHPLF